MLFRDSRDEDLPAMAGIYAHYVRHTTASFEIEPPDAAELARRRALVLAAGLPWLAAEVDGAVAGYAYAAPYRPRGAYRFTVEDSIYLHPESTGRGIGAELLDRLIARCARAGKRQMVAVIGGSDNYASIRLHEKFGFRRAGVLTSAGYKFDRWVDSVLMQRALGPGDTAPPAAS
ncbi:MAG: N-acetyltransferase [Acidobacteria bacterium]|nr:N-acetyltransferase [Acidobacteriota bacterium]